MVKDLRSEKHRKENAKQAAAKGSLSSSKSALSGYHSVRAPTADLETLKETIMAKMESRDTWEKFKSARSGRGIWKNGVLKLEKKNCPRLGPEVHHQRGLFEPPAAH